MKIFLVVLESDKTSVTSASFDQFKAQRLCHEIAKDSGISHAVVTEEVRASLLPLIGSLKHKCVHFFNECVRLGF